MSVRVRKCYAFLNLTNPERGGSYGAVTTTNFFDMTLNVISAEELAQVIEQTVEATVIKVLQQVNSGVTFLPQDVMTSAELVVYLRQQGVQMAKQTLFMHTHRGTIPFYKVGSKLRFKREEIDQWLEEQMNKSRSERKADKSAGVRAMAESAANQIKRNK